MCFSYITFYFCSQILSYATTSVRENMPTYDEKFPEEEEDEYMKRIRVSILVGILGKKLFKDFG